MNRKRRLKRGAALALACLMTAQLTAGVSWATATEDSTVVVQSPDGEGPSISVWVDQGVPYYQVKHGNVQMVEPSKLGLSTSLGEMKDEFTMGEVSWSQSDTTWSPVVGEQSQIRDHYQQASIPMTSGELTYTLEVRAYDTGVAFRYVLPESQESYTVSGEYTQFVFPAETVANVHQNGNQTMPKQVPVEQFSSTTYMRPLTLQYPNGYAMTICEANLDHYSVMAMTKDSSTPRALTAKYLGYKPSRPAGVKGQGPEVTVEGGTPSATPWRTFVVGENEAQLPANSSIVMNLNEAADEETYQFSNWVEPGSCLRAVTGMNTTDICDIVDQAQAKGIKYVLLDTGWYGPEYDVNCDPRLDPSLLDPSVPSDKILLDQYFAREGEDTFLPNGEGVFNTRGKGFDKYGNLGTPGTFQTNVDIPAICDYANRHDVGIILYVNGVYLPDSSGRDRFGAEELFSKFESWGVKGVKPGFVHVRAQKYESYMQEVVEAAARHHLIMTVHDEYVTTGLERTFPNLFCTEGILGDEGIGKNSPNVEQDIATLFTRTIQGPTDHTFCWPGKATKAYALASPLMFRTGMSVLYWYTNPDAVPEQDKDKMGFWDNFPGTWEESLYLEGSMYEYATYARRSGQTWYLGSLTAVERTLEVPLDFLEPGVTYVAELYTDGSDADARAGWNSAAKKNQTLEVNRYLVTCDTVLKRDLKYGFGYAAKMTPATQEELDTLTPYSPQLELLKTRWEEGMKLESGNYGPDSWAAFQQAMDEAKAILDDPNAYTTQQMDEALEALTRSMEALVDLTPIQALLGQVDRLTPHHYSLGSWAELSAVVEQAEEMLAGSFSQSEMDEMCRLLEQALEELETAPNAQVDRQVYLSDLEYTNQSWSVSQGQQSMIKKDKNRADGTLALMVNGKKTQFPKGMGLDAPGELYYNIEGMGYELFQGYVGVDANKPDMGSIIFRVYGDGQLLYESRKANTGKDEAQYFSIPIAGVKQLRLESDMVDNRNGDWADWADAQLVTYRQPQGDVVSISVDGMSLDEFQPQRTTYYYPVESGAEVPVVTAACTANATVSVTQAQQTPGTARVLLSRVDGSQEEYLVHFCTTRHMEYLSDLDESSIVSNTLHYDKVFQDTSCKGDPIAVTKEDGKTKWSFEKGIGVHANDLTDSSVVYDIQGKGYQRFECYVGMRYAVYDEEINSGYHPPRSSVVFRVYVDDETQPRYESPVMYARTPAQWVSVDVADASTIRLVVDAKGDKSADHANWADAQFLSCVVKDENVNKTLLQKTYEYAENLPTQGVVESAVVAFEQAKVQAKEVLDNDYATQEEVNAAWDALLEAIWGLGLTQGDKTMLEQLIAKADNMIASADKYVATHWKQLVDALDAANEVMDDGNAMEEDVQPAAEALLNAILAQRFKADKAILDDLIGQAEGINLEGYTAQSVAAFRTALTKAQAVMADATLSEDDQAKVDEAVAALSAAMDGLTADGAPETTDKPEASEKPENTHKPQATEKPEDVPQTGDSAQLMGYVAALAAAVVVMGSTMVVRRRRS